MRAKVSPIGPGLLLAVVVLSICTSPAAAQNVSGFVTSAPQPAAPAGGVHGRRILSDIASDQRDIWTSPFRLGKRDAKWVIPSLLITVALIGSDKEINQNVINRSTEGSVRTSNRVSNLGSGYALYAASGVFYLAGRISHDDRARETGLLAIEALVDQYVVVTALKAGTNRERPNKANGRQDFYDGGNAFPSGHAAATWSFATVVAEQYRDRPLVRWGAYGLAAAVSLSRVTATKHSPSDVFVGGIIGYLIGRHVARRGASSDASTSVVFAPRVDPSTRTYGISGTLQF